MSISIALPTYHSKMKISNYSLILCFYTVNLISMATYVLGDWLVCGDCKCKWNSGKKMGDCRNNSLQTIPDYLHSELQVLDLSLNRIAVIEEDAFLKSGLQNLHKLFMRNCSLELILPNGLRGLEILIELDLSSNLMKTLSPDLFVSCVKLRSLILNNNAIESLEDGLFRDLEYLKKVELKENRLVSIGVNVFVNVPLLSQVFLSGNKLSYLRRESFSALGHFQSLSLELNPWNCTCELQDFREFVLRRNLYTPPTSCHDPPQLRGMLWNDNQTVPFACKPRIVYPPRGTSINTSKENVTLTCRVHTSPSTIINWEYNKQIYLSNYQRIHIQSTRDEKRANTSSREIGRELVTSRLTIVGAEKSDEGYYSCVAINSAGKDEVEMRLLVEKHSHQNILVQNNLIIVICLMVLGLLSASIFLAMITCCIYKKFRAINHRAAEDQQLQQKRNFRALNVINATNEPYHYASGNCDASYMEIKAAKLQPEHIRNGDVGSAVVSNIKNFTNLDAVSQDSYDAGNVQNSYPHRLGQYAAELLPSQQKPALESGAAEYQPDLLPYISQSMPASNSGFYTTTTGGAVPSTTISTKSCNGHHQTMAYHTHEKQQFHPHHCPVQASRQDVGDNCEPGALPFSRISSQRLKTHSDIIDNSFESTNNSIWRDDGSRPGIRAGTGLDLQHDTRAISTNCRTTNSTLPPENILTTVNKVVNNDRSFDTIHYNSASKYPLVRSSPSLNFLSNCQCPRQELL